MGCQQSSPAAVEEFSSSNKSKKSTSLPAKLHPLLTDSEREETKRILQQQFSVDADFVVHFTHVKSKMHQKLLQARQHLQEQNAAKGNNNSTSQQQRHNSKSPRISFAVYQDELHAKPSREQKIAHGVELIQQRLTHLHLQQDVMRDDGNCQFRSLAHQLYGNQDKYHEKVRRRVTSYLQQHEDMFSFYFESPEEWQRYLRQMQQLGTWGDELTLKAASNAFHVKVHVITSEEENYYLCYEPDDGNSDDAPVDIFLAYISPIHYNSIELKKKKR